MTFTLTFVDTVSSPNHSNDNPDIHLVEDALREGLETSRQLVRQSRLLIELSEADAANDDDFSVANEPLARDRSAAHLIALRPCR